MSIIDKVAGYIGITSSELVYLGKRASSTHKIYKIPKKKGGHRVIHHPSKVTKSIQYSLIEILLKKLPVNQHAMAYKKETAKFRKSPLLKNAQSHSKYAYSVKIDFVDFFHSIRPIDLLRQIKKNNCFSKLSSEEERFIENVFFIKIQSNKGLAIGAPSSPIISNIVMYELDNEISNCANRISKKSCYTRYSDDITFSVNQKGACKSFLDALAGILDNTASPKLSINPNKTKFLSRGNRRVITGLFIRPDGGISLGRHNKRYIKKLIYDLGKDNLESIEDKNYLSGYLGHILSVEPEFYNRLVIKYGETVLERAIKGN